MFEFDKYDPRLHHERPATPAKSYAPADDVEGIAFLHWGERCVEWRRTGVLFELRPLPAALRRAMPALRPRRLQESGLPLDARLWGRGLVQEMGEDRGVW